jgi:hypothetical protein
LFAFLFSIQIVQIAHVVSVGAIFHEISLHGVDTESIGFTCPRTQKPAPRSEDHARQERRACSENPPRWRAPSIETVGQSDSIFRLHLIPDERALLPRLLRKIESVKELQKKAKAKTK